VRERDGANLVEASEKDEDGLISFVLEKLQYYLENNFTDRLN